MLETLDFIMSSPETFFGTLVLILVSGLALSMALSPFGKPRNIDMYFGEGEKWEK